MKNFILGLSLSVAFIIGCLARPLLEQPVQASPTSQQWQYRCFENHGAEDVETDANRLGKFGYEMAAATSVGFRLHWCFKRKAR